MRFALIDPFIRQVRPLEASNVQTAMVEAELKPGEVDFGSLGRQYGIVVYEFGLFAPPEETAYFCFPRELGFAPRLYAGKAVVFQLDGGGETVSLTEMPEVVFLRTPEEVETAILGDLVARPVLSTNGVTHWQWPSPVPRETGPKEFLRGITQR